MALNLKFADAYVELSLLRNRYDSDMLKVQRDLARFPGTLTIGVALNAAQFRKDMVAVRLELSKIRTFQIGITVDRARAAAAINLMRQQISSIQGRGGTRIRFNADLVQWRRSIVQVFTDLNRVRAFASTIPIRVNATAAHANINLLMQQLRTAQTLTKFQVTGIGRRGLGGGGAVGRTGGSQFLQGLGMGAGLPYASSPQMMAGDLLGKALIGTVKTAADLESEFIELRRITGMTADQVAGFQTSLFDLAQSQPGVSVSDLVGMSQIGGRAGVADKEGPAGLLRYTEGLAKVRNVITDIPAEELAESITKVLNVFGEGTDRVEGFGSALAKMDTISVASARDILQISREFSGTANAIKMTIPQTLAFASVLKDVGLTNAQASGSYNQIFRVMASSHEKIADLIGVEGSAFKKAYETDAVSALDMVIGKLKTIESSVAAQEFLKDLGFKGVRSGAAIGQLASMNEQVRKRAEIASAETGSLATLNTANALKGSATNNQFTRAGNAITDLAKASGDRLAPAARGAAGVVADIASGLASVVRTGFRTNQVSFAGGPSGIAKAVLAPLPAKNPKGAPVLDFEDAKAAEDAAQQRLTDARFNADATTAQARGLGFGARQAMAAAADPGAQANAEALMRQAFVAEEAAKAAALELAAATRGLQAAVDKTAVFEREKAVKDADADRRNRVDNAMFDARNRLGNVMAAVGDMRQGLFGVGAKAAGQLAGALVPEKKKEQTFSSGLTGAEVGRQLQDAILNMNKDKPGEETAKNTAEAKKSLGEMVAIMRRGGEGLAAAVFGR